MTGAEDWQDENTRYLSTAIAWIRAALEQRSGGAAKIAAPGTASPSGDARKPFWRGKPRDALTGHPEVLMLPPDTSAAPAQPSEANVADPEPHQDAPKTPPALVTLRERLGLTRFEQDVLMLCAAMELDTSIAGLCARAQGDPSRAYPTFALALSLFEQASWDVVSPERGLRHWRLIEINQQSGQTLTSSPLRADEWVVNYLKGLTYLDDRLSPLVSPMPLSGNADDVPESQRAAASIVLDRLKLGFPDGKLPPIQLIGEVTARAEAAVAGPDLRMSFGLATLSHDGADDPLHASGPRKLRAAMAAPKPAAPHRALYRRARRRGAAGGRGRAVAVAAQLPRHSRHARSDAGACANDLRRCRQAHAGGAARGLGAGSRRASG